MVCDHWYLFETIRSCGAFSPAMTLGWSAAALAGAVMVMLFALGILIRGVSHKVRRPIICFLVATFPMIVITGQGVHYSMHPDSDTKSLQVLRWVCSSFVLVLTMFSVRECSFAFLDIVVLTRELREEGHIKWFKYSFDIPTAMMAIQLPFTYVIIPFAVARSDYEREVSVRIGAGLVAFSIALSIALYTFFSWQLVQLMKKLLTLNIVTGDAHSSLKEKIKIQMFGAGVAMTSCMIEVILHIVAAVWGFHYPISLALIWGFVIGVPGALYAFAGYRPKNSSTDNIVLSNERKSTATVANLSTAAVDRKSTAADRKSTAADWRKTTAADRKKIITIDRNSTAVQTTELVLF